RIMVTDIEHLSPSEWKELIPEGEGIIDTFNIIGRKLVVRFLQDVHTRVGIFNLSGEHLYDLEFPTMGSVDVSGHWDSPELFCSFESFFYPITIFRFNVDTGIRETIFQLDVGRELSDYVLKQIRYKSKDGTEVPLWLLHKKGIRLDGNNPTILTGYGGFNNPQKPYFTRTLLPWLDKGGVYAVACLRGGGEFGEEWHKAGMLKNKQNVFDDFVAAAEWLIESKWTNSGKLAISGGSNGGLLVGAALTQRPDLYKAVVCEVPLLDMLRYHKFHFARLWIPEYGSAEVEEQFKYIKKYSPYHNVDPNKEYPAVLFTAGRSDTRVHPMHAMKMAALMQGVIDKGTSILLFVEPKTGHGVGRPLTMALQDISNQYLFIMWQMDMI
ncbi:S9 family peptidase, partial [candidate division WOR-3 bacterium]|nr:S9 family peptidase [candidate division WOR-3 bacterium]